MSSGSENQATAQIVTNSNTTFGDNQWPMFHHDISHTGYSTSLAPDTNASLWNYTAGNQIISSPAIANGRVYFGSRDGNVYCLDAGIGLELWRYNTSHLVCSSPAIYENRVYVGSNDIPGLNGSHFFCLNADTGELIWEYTTGDESMVGFYSSPAVVSGRVYVGSGDHKVYCFDAMTGMKLWEFMTGYDVDSSPAVVNGRVYIGSEDGCVYCLNASTGAELWMYPTQSEIWSASPTVVNGKVYIGSDKLYCLDAESGVHLWDKQPDFSHSTPAFFHDNIYVCDSTDTVYCLNATYGWIMWQYQVSAGDLGMWSSPAVADGKVYVGGGDGKVYCLDALTGAKLWEYQTGFFSYPIYSCPAIAENFMFIGDNTGTMHCFCGTSHPPEAPILYGPDLGAINLWYTFCINSIVNPNGDEFLVICDWGDGNISEWQDPLIPGQNISGSHMWTRPGVYGIRVYVKDVWGARSPWSNLHNITIVDNKPPTTPTITGPNRVRKGVTYVYNAFAIDPNQDNISYFFDWGDGSGSGWIGPYLSGMQAHVSHSFGFVGDVCVKVKAKDSWGAESDWGTLPIRIPSGMLAPPFFPWLFERFPNAFPLLRYFLRCL